jgi:hypothetical protein
VGVKRDEQGYLRRWRRRSRRAHIENALATDQEMTSRRDFYYPLLHGDGITVSQVKRGACIATAAIAGGHHLLLQMLPLHLLICRQRTNRWEITNTKPPGPIIMIGHREKQSDHNYYTLLWWQVTNFFSAFTSLKKLCKNARSKHFAEPSGYVLISLHPIVMRRVT